MRELKVLSSSRLLAAVTCICATVATPTSAAPVFATFEVIDNISTVYVPVETLPSRKYVFMFDPDRAGQLRTPDGLLVEVQDQAPFDFFYADLVTGNYVKSGTSTPQQFNNQGSWANKNGQAVWGSGPTYGTFDYKTVFTLSVGTVDDLVSASGMWADFVSFSGVEALLTPGAFWIIGDNGVRADGGSFYGYFTARLDSLSATDPRSVPEPTSAALGALALLAAVGVGAARPRRRH